MRPDEMPRRFRGLPLADLGASDPVPVATTRLARLVGLAHLDRQVAPGLLIPGCRAVHTFGMRFSIDLHFLDASGRAIAARYDVPPRRLAMERRAQSVLELPAGLERRP